MLAAFEQWGIEAAVKRFEGMFAFAVWDRVDRTLYLVRDPLGQKPLYYTWMNGVFLFGSELKALRPHPSFRPEINPAPWCCCCVIVIFRIRYSIYHGVHKLAPGSILAYRWLPLATVRGRDTSAYWSAADTVCARAGRPLARGRRGGPDQARSAAQGSGAAGT